MSLGRKGVSLVVMTFRTRWRSDADRWSKEGAKISSPESLSVIRDNIDELGPIIVEHWFYRGSSAPDRIVFDDYSDFIEYLRKNAYAGDDIHIWSFAAVCNSDNRLLNGKCPNNNGEVPKGGPY
jgi:hypothetical protein